MNKSGRVYHIGDHLTEAQITRFATLLAEVVEAGVGQVTITVNNHHVLRVMVMFDEAMPKKEESPPINPNFRG